MYKVLQCSWKHTK